MDKTLEQMFGKREAEPSVQPDRPFPTVPTDLLKELERRFPTDTSAYLKIQPHEAAFAMGSMLGIAAVLTLLRAEHAKQSNRPHVL